MEKVINLLPYDLTIKFQPAEDLVAAGAFGSMAVTAATIKYQKGLSRREKLSTIFHELLETANAALLNGTLKHDDIEILDQFLALSCIELGITLDLPEDEPNKSRPPNSSTDTTFFDPKIPVTFTAP